jgi:hypothetical protein
MTRAKERVVKAANLMCDKEGWLILNRDGTTRVLLSIFQQRRGNFEEAIQDYRAALSRKSRKTGRLP